MSTTLSLPFTGFLSLTGPDPSCSAVRPMERIDSTNSTWLFDPEQMRFRRLPRGVDPGDPAMSAEWQPYYALEFDGETGSFTVALNPERTRLLRSWRDPETVPHPPAEPTTELRTAELAVEPVDE